MPEGSDQHVFLPDDGENATMLYRVTDERVEICSVYKLMVQMILHQNMVVH